jgi:hypothetical protein
MKRKCFLVPFKTDPISFTPSGSFVTNSTYTGSWYRDGHNMVCRTKIAFSGAPNSVACTVNIPSGVTIDTTFLMSTTAGREYLGAGIADDTGALTYLLKVGYNTTTSVKLDALNTTVSYDQSDAVTQAVPFSFGSGDSIQIVFTIPILGWRANRRVC